MKNLVFTLLILPSICTATEMYQTQVTKVLDGDTIHIYLGTIPFQKMKEISVRIDGINSPEVHSKCAIEKENGLNAKKLLSDKILDKTVTLVDCTNDKFARWLCKVDYNGEDISQFMLKSKLAVEYHGEKKDPKTWCPTK